MDTCRLRVKIGPYEMEAEGPRDFVEKHYGSFSERIPQTNQLATIAAPPVPAVAPSAESGAESPLAPIFHQESNGRLLSLTAKPPGDTTELGGALILLLGHKELRGADLVSADELLYGLKQSGYSVDRADRITARGEDQGLIVKSGVRRGTRYRLTNQGMVAARSLAQEVLSLVS